MEEEKREEGRERRGERRGEADEGEVPLRKKEIGRRGKSLLENTLFHGQFHSQ